MVEKENHCGEAKEKSRETNKFCLPKSLLFVNDSPWTVSGVKVSIHVNRTIRGQYLHFD